MAELIRLTLLCLIVHHGMLLDIYGWVFPSYCRRWKKMRKRQCAKRLAIIMEAASVLQQVRGVDDDNEDVGG